MTICIAPYLPREGPETRPKMAFHRCVGLLDIATYLPREGTETWFSWYFWFFNNRIATYLPREGTETYGKHLVTHELNV